MFRFTFPHVGSTSSISAMLKGVSFQFMLPGWGAEPKRPTKRKDACFNSRPPSGEHLEPYATPHRQR